MGDIRKQTRIALATGGFLIMIGMITVGTCALALLNVLDISVLVDGAHAPIFLATLLLIVVLDALATALLSRR